MAIAVRIENVSKEYRLGVINNGRLYRDIQSGWARLRGREDPWSTIGQESRFGRKGSFFALKNVSLEVEQGQRVGIMGRNGAGKSTLLKILSRITAPTSGCVKVRGRMASLLEVGTGFHPELTGRENVFLNGAILGMKKAEIQRKFDAIVAFSEIEPFIDTPVKRYSSGMFVRLAFAVAAHLDAEILVADEVLAVGDVKFQEKSLGKMQDVSNNEGRTILFVSHNAAAVRKLCNVGVLLEQGVLIRLENNIEHVIQEYNTLLGS
jgi:lipopolysaccharide transport system ATP-binding protein